MVSAVEQQPPGLTTASDLNYPDDATDQHFCIFFKDGLQNLDHELPIQTTEAQDTQNPSLGSHNLPPLVPVYCLQVLVQPGQHGSQELLISREQFCPDTRQETSHRSFLIETGHSRLQ